MEHLLLLCLLLALALTITSFWLLFAARSVLRSTSMLPLSLLTAYTFWRGLAARDRWPWFWFVSGGFCLDLSLYTYTAARVTACSWPRFLLSKA